MRAPLKTAMVNWAPSLNIIIIFIMIMMMIMVIVMMHNVWYRRKAKLMKPLKFLSIKQLFCKKRLHNVLIGSKIKT